MEKDNNLRKKIEKQKRKLEKETPKKGIEDKEFQKVSENLDELINKYYKH